MPEHTCYFCKTSMDVTERDIEYMAGSYVKRWTCLACFTGPSDAEVAEKINRDRI